MAKAKPSSSQASCEPRSSGFALVAVLVFLLVVSAITSTFALAAWTQRTVAVNELQVQKLSLLAEGLTNVLAARLSGEGTDTKLPLNFEPVACTASGLAIVTRLQGHAGLIDLNAADHNLLALGFASLGLDADTSRDLSIAVEYFRSGASIFAAAAKAKVDVAGGYKFARFESVAELQDFAPLRTVPLTDLYRTFTVNSRSGAFVPAEAPAALATAQMVGRYPRWAEEITAFHLPRQLKALDDTSEAAARSSPSAAPHPPQQLRRVDRHLFPYSDGKQLLMPTAAWSSSDTAAPSRRRRSA
ncbi:hypothetical protein EOD23_01395 [Mesorhizobium sp. USDA-HM6]|nr:hypothetical protein EOD23_01395 [Mesorhizobium sp. USDA-HM6]